MFDIDRKAHCYFVEPLSEQKHVKMILVKRFLSFVEQLKKSNNGGPKPVSSYQEKCFICDWVKSETNYDPGRKTKY